MGVAASRTVDEIDVYSDGASRGNPGPAAIGYAIYDSNGSLLESGAKCIDDCTNNEAEYRALLWAMNQACGQCRRTARFYTDSELMVRQVNRVYRVRAYHLLLLMREVTTNKSDFDSFALNYVSRTHPRLCSVDKAINDVLNKRGM